MPLVSLDVSVRPNKSPILYIIKIIGFKTNITFKIKRKFANNSERVKSVDLHPSEPWIISGLYNGMVYIYNYQTQTTFKQVEVTSHPIRCVRFIPRKQWFVTCSDDMHIRVHNINTMELIHKWEAHSHFIRSVAVHPTQPYILSASDDMKIKLWSWEKNFSLIRTFEGHSHIIMHVVFNPKDPNTFASASLDRTVKVWSLGTSVPNFTLEGHEDGVSTVDYHLGGDKPYLVSGADDRLVKVWDYQTKACIHTLEGHFDNITSVVFHPELPLILSASEDGSIKLWNNTTYRLEKTIGYGWDRAWSLSCVKGNHGLAIGYDNGTMYLKMGKEIPSASMDATGKVVFARHTSINGYNLMQAFGSNSTPPEDGETLPLGLKELGTCEFFPQNLKHNFNGRFIVATGDGEYVIYTALQVRSKKFGNANDFIWDRSGGFAIRDAKGNIVLHDKNFEEIRSFRPDFYTDGMFGGTLIGVKGNGFICMYDWQQTRLIQKIDVSPKQVIWSESGDHVAISTEAGFYILRYNEETVLQTLESGGSVPEDGVENAFSVVHELPEKVRSAWWVGDCFIYTNSQNIIKYVVGKRTDTVAHLDRTMYLLGYLPKQNRLVLIDKAYNIVTYTLQLSVVNFQTAVLREDIETAKQLLPNIPSSELSRVAQFLETVNMHEWALELTTDPDHKFDLAIQLNKLELAHDLAVKFESEEKWRQIGELALNSLNIQLAEECMWRSEDYSSLLLLYSSNGDHTKMQKLAEITQAKGKFNIAFTAFFNLNRIENCIELLMSAGRLGEAAFMARAYAPSMLPTVVDEWKSEVKQHSPRQADMIASPIQYANLFPEYKSTIEQEASWKASTKFPDVPAQNFVYLLAGDMDKAMISSSNNQLSQPLIQHTQQSQNNSPSPNNRSNGGSSPLIQKGDHKDTPMHQLYSPAKTQSPTSVSNSSSSENLHLSSPIRTPTQILLETEHSTQDNEISQDLLSQSQTQTDHEDFKEDTTTTDKSDQQTFVDKNFESESIDQTELERHTNLPTEIPSVSFEDFDDDLEL